ncbi:MAG: acetylxylan esterase [Planctomycetaceae bacterium]|nr:acetylxylan esterase [Planctomycetaceae bacterium]
MNLFSQRHLIGLSVCLFLMVSPMSDEVYGDEFNYDESKVPQFTLPDLLKAQDGSDIDSAEKWVNIRRPEILQLFADHVFGHLPPAVNKLRTRIRSEKNDAVQGKAIRREITVFFTSEDDGPQMDMLVYTPKSATGPVPAFIGLNFNGNHTVEDDPAIHITSSWVRNNKDLGITDNRASEASRGKSSGRWPVAEIIGAGYGLVTIYYGDIDPDFDDGFKNGVHAIWPESQNRTASSGGSISAWAWGLSRALDVLEVDPLIDGSKVAVVGHSRLGKTSLWAGATDQRFAMVISNDSGCGGAALSRRAFGETVKRINTSFPHWFCMQHRTYNDNETASPVDHHMLIALAAPRPIYVASAEDDKWADPRGEFLSAQLAGSVYELLGRKGLPSDSMPAVNQPLVADVGYHIRTGKHDINEYDWAQYIKFANQHLKGNH